MIIVAGTLTFDPAKAGVLAEGWDKMQKATLEEPGCLAYDYFLSRHEEGVILVFEKWESEDALAAHMQTSHMAEFGGVDGPDRHHERRRQEVQRRHRRPAVLTPSPSVSEPEIVFLCTGNAA